MKATIFSHKIIIGTTDLEVGDFTMGGLFGNFYPNKNYFDKIQKYVWKFWSSRKVNYKEWNSLNFSIQLENGMFIFPIGGITFDDIEELKYEPKRIDLFGIDTRIIENYIIGKPLKPFLKEPWKIISIDEKIEYETVFLKRINKSKSFLNILKINKEKYILSNLTISAFCKNSYTGSILFEIYDKKIEKQFALIQSNSIEKIDYFTDFDEFKYSRMYPDNEKREVKK